MGKLGNNRLISNSGEGDHPDDGYGEGSVAIAESKPQLKKPPLYQVVLINDDFTPMEFVVEILQTYFYMNREKATQVMLDVHTQGKGVCGIYPRDIAETKMMQVNEHSKQAAHPLMCVIEKAL